METEERRHVKYAMKNLELIDEREAVIPITQGEIFSSFGVYESIKVFNGQAEHVNDHLERLFESARILKLEHNFTINDIISSLDILIKANGDMKVSLKLQLIGGRTPCLFAFTTELPEYPAEYYIDGATVISFAGERIYPHAKSNCLLLNYMAAREAGLSGALDAILIDRFGFALEGSRSNLFAVRGNTLITSEEDVLYGVTRKRTIEIAKNLNLTLEFKKIALKDIKEHIFDEVFITSTSMGAIPVKAIDDINIGSSFPITSLINKNLI